MGLVQKKDALRDISATRNGAPGGNAVELPVDPRAAVSTERSWHRALVLLSIRPEELPHLCHAGSCSSSVGLKLSHYSRSSNARLRQIPQRYPEMLPFFLTTRWHGITTAILLAAQASPTFRATPGPSSLQASSR